MAENVQELGEIQQRWQGKLNAWHRHLFWTWIVWSENNQAAHSCMTPLLHGIGCVLSYTIAGSRTGWVHHARGARFICSPSKIPFPMIHVLGPMESAFDRLIHSFTAVIYVMFSVLKILFLRGTLTSCKHYCSNVVCWSSDAANWYMHPETYHVMMFFYNFVNVTINLSYDGRQ